MGLFTSKEEKQKKAQERAEKILHNGFFLGHVDASYQIRGFDMVNGRIELLQSLAPQPSSSFRDGLPIGPVSDYMLLLILRMQLIETFQEVRLNNPPDTYEWDLDDMWDLDYMIPEPGRYGSEELLGAFIDHDWGIGSRRYIFYYAPSLVFTEWYNPMNEDTFHLADGLLPLHIYIGDKSQERFISYLRIFVGLDENFELIWVCRDGLGCTYSKTDMIKSDILKSVFPSENLKPYGLFGKFKDPTEDHEERQYWGFDGWPHRELMMMSQT
ncbi:MAG: hypothetical protein P9X24_04385 [Candidatus Hatepunaea meridiana]|nr:hypothetical protein [Candidatus Hatepunaea meridiana]